MTSQQSFLPKTSASASTSRSAASLTLPKLDAKAWSRLSVFFASFGAVAFLQNAGFVPGSSLLNSSPSAAENDGGRSLMLEDGELVVTQLNERVLQVAVNGLTEGYYSDRSGEFGPGCCADSHGPPQMYDYTEHYEITAAKCANRCAKTLLLNEHRGFDYDEGNSICRCLYDNHRLPLSERQKAGAYNVDHNGDGEIAGADPSMPSFKCYVKEGSALGNAIDSYSVEECPADGPVEDVVIFSPVFGSTDCAEKCIRFKLFATHKGFTHQSDQCSCSFYRGEAPSSRKLSGSGAVPQRGMTHQARKAGMADQENVLCYKKNALQGASAENLVPVDTNQRVWINEFHYRNAGPNEPFVEVIGPKGQDASDYDVVAYQGRNGGIHYTIPLTGTFDGADAEWGFVTVDLNSPDLRKGKQGGDGLALVQKSTNKCVQLLSYTDAPGVDRSFLAKEGICINKASEPIGVFEERQTTAGHSLQLAGTGNTVSAFTWQNPGPSTKGEANIGQNLLPV